MQQFQRLPIVRKMRWPFLFILFAASMPPSLEEGLRRVSAHQLIEDGDSAVAEARGLVISYPDSSQAIASLVEALSAKGWIDEALQEWKQLKARFPKEALQRPVLEALGWGMLKKGISSSQYGVRLGAMVGSFLTRDAKAVSVLKKMLRDSNAVIRTVAVQMSSEYGDAALKDEIERMLVEEKVWLVRMEAIRAAGVLRIRSAAPLLESILESDRSMAEEREAAIHALIYMWGDATAVDVSKLAKSNRAGLRHLASAIATHFEMKECLNDVLALLNDPHPAVRISALNGLGLFYRKEMTQEALYPAIQARLEEKDPTVSITACWAALIAGMPEGEAKLRKWLTDAYAENRRLAAAALAKTGPFGASLAVETLKESKDSYVKANVALGLIGERREMKAACDTIYSFLTEEKRRWMWDPRSNPLFQVLAPSEVRHIDQIPNLPEAIDQMTRLNLVSLLAIAEDERAIQALKKFLSEKKWGITGVAAATLLQEGDESALEIVRTLLQEKDRTIRLQACLVLAMYGKDPTVIKDLEESFVGADFETKLHILEALGQVGGEDSFPFLVAVLDEPFPILKVAAAASLIQSIHR